MPLTTLAELVNIGTLSAFILVSAGVVVYFGYGARHRRLAREEA